MPVGIVLAVVSTSTTEILVVATPIRIDQSATASEIPRARLIAARRRGESTGEIVDTVAGARVLDLGGPVGDRRATIRGGAPSQLLTIVDGVVLGSSFASGTDVGVVDPESIGSMRVLRGGQGALYGDGALTGVLLIDTLRPGRPRASVSAGGGSFGTGRAALALSAESLALGSVYEETRGDFAFDDRPAGLDAVERMRSNNDARRGALTLSVKRRFGELEAVSAASIAFRDAGVPGLISDARISAREARRSAHGRASVTAPLARGELRLGLGAQHLALDYADPERGEASISRFTTIAFDARADVPIGDVNVARIFAEVGGELAESTEHGRPARFRASAAISDELVAGDFTIFAALRTVSVTGQKASLLPRLGARWDVLDAMYLRAGAGGSLRTPAIDELYRPPEAGLSGNPNLVAERAWEAEVAIGGRIEELAAELVVFGRSIDDTILYLRQNAFEIRPENVGASLAIGGEAELAVDLLLGPIRASGFASAALLFSELEVTGERLPTQPVWSGAATLDIGWGPVQLFTGARWFGPTSTRIGSDLPENRVPTYARWDAGIEVIPVEPLSFSLRCTNLLDDRELQSVHKIPLPGRAFFFNVRLSFDGR